MKDHDGRTPLHCAASAGNLAIVTLLLDRGAIIDAHDRYNVTPYEEAEKHGNKVHLALLRARTPEAHSSAHHVPPACDRAAGIKRRTQRDQGGEDTPTAATCRATRTTHQTAHAFARHAPDLQLDADARLGALRRHHHNHLVILERRFATLTPAATRAIAHARRRSTNSATRVRHAVRFVSGFLHAAPTAAIHYSPTKPREQASLIVQQYKLQLSARARKLALSNKTKGAARAFILMCKILRGTLGALDPYGVEHVVCAFDQERRLEMRRIVHDQVDVAVVLRTEGRPHGLGLHPLFEDHGACSADHKVRRVDRIDVHLGIAGGRL